METTARTVSMSDTDWDHIVVALRAYAEMQGALGWTHTANEAETLATLLAMSLAFAREQTDQLG